MDGAGRGQPKNKSCSSAVRCSQKCLGADSALQECGTNLRDRFVSPDSKGLPIAPEYINIIIFITFSSDLPAMIFGDQERGREKEGFMTIFT